MRLTIESKKLLRGLEVVKPVVTSNKVVPVCDNVLIRSDRDCIALIATNLNHSIITQIPCEVRGKINALIPFMDIYNICKGLPDQSLDIELGKNIKVTSVNGTYNIGNIDDIDVFPKVEVIQGNSETEIASSQISQIKDRTLKFACKDEMKGSMYGVCFEFDDSYLNVVATNGGCLSLFKIPNTSNAGRYLLNKDTIDLMQVFSFSGYVNMKFSENKFQIENEDTILISPLMDEVFPEYKWMFKNTDCSIEVNRVELLNSLLRGVKFSNEDLTIVSFSDSMGVSFENNDYGKDFNEKIELINSKGFEEETAKLNAKQIIDYLSACTSKNITLGCEKGNNAFFIQEPESENIFITMRHF
jgi:DNA polymerase III subunit beta